MGEIVSIISYTETNIPTVEEMQNRWCFGLPLTRVDTGEPMNPDDIHAIIMGAVREVERRLGGIYLKPTIIKANPESRGLEEGIDYEVAEPPYDYDAQRYRSWGYIKLRENPIVSVEKIVLRLPNEMQVIDFPLEWVKVYKEPGQIHIVPYAGSPTVAAMFLASGSGAPLLSGTFMRDIPQCLFIDYTAGFPKQKLPEDVRDVTAKIAAVNILGIAGDAILAGIASMSTGIDGLSESYSTTASATSATYGAHILQYQQEIAAFFGEGKTVGERSTGPGGAKSYYKGFTMEVL